MQRENWPIVLGTSTGVYNSCLDSWYGMSQVAL